LEAGSIDFYYCLDINLCILNPLKISCGFADEEYQKEGKYAGHVNAMTVKALRSLLKATNS